MAQKIQTVTGAIEPDALGKTLMHEHLLIAYPGAESHRSVTGSGGDRVAVCVDRIAELQELGFTSMLDPCPNDLGRDVDLMAEVAGRTGFQIVCATGLYKQSEGGYPYWEFRARFGSQVEAMTELFVRELVEGIGDTGIRAGIIKVATGAGQITEHERTVLLAAAAASRETGAPITTHTDQGTMGDAQQKLLTENGVPAHRIVIGHSCGTDDHAYHMAIAREGSYLGFDRFGLDMLHPDEKRVASLAALIRAGAGDRVVVSHDSVWCWAGQPFPPALEAAVADVWNPTHFTRRIAPRLREAGVSDEEIDALLVENPRRFFAGEKLAALA